MWLPAFAMCFYLPYGTWAISHALGLANGGSGQITLVMVIGAFCVTGVIIGFDALIISYVAVNANDLDDSEAPPIGKLSRAMIASAPRDRGRHGRRLHDPDPAVLLPAGDDRGSGRAEPAAIASLHRARSARADPSSDQTADRVRRQSDPNSVLALENRASALDQASASDYQLALQDSAGQRCDPPVRVARWAVTCWALQQKSQQEASEAKALRQQADSPPSQSEGTTLE